MQDKGGRRLWDYVQKQTHSHHYFISMGNHLNLEIHMVGYLTENYYGQLMNTVNNPSIGYTEQSEQLVKSTRNAEGKVVAQTINRRLNKFESLTWPYLSRVSVTWLKQEIKKFYCTLGYWDDEANQFVERKYYWGDFSATPCEWETVWDNSRQIYFKRPIWYKDVKCNLIDCGY